MRNKGEIQLSFRLKTDIFKRVQSKPTLLVRFVHCSFTHSQKNYCDKPHASPHRSLTCLQPLL